MKRQDVNQISYKSHRNKIKPNTGERSTFLNYKPLVTSPSPPTKLHQEVVVKPLERNYNPVQGHRSPTKNTPSTPLVEQLSPYAERSPYKTYEKVRPRKDPGSPAKKTLGKTLNALPPIVNSQSSRSAVNPVKIVNLKLNDEKPNDSWNQKPAVNKWEARAEEMKRRQASRTDRRPNLTEKVRGVTPTEITAKGSPKLPLPESPLKRVKENYALPVFDSRKARGMDVHKSVTELDVRVPLGHRNSETPTYGWRARVQEKLKPLGSGVRRTGFMESKRDDEKVDGRSIIRHVVNEITGKKELAPEKSALELKARMAKEMEKERLAWSRGVVQKECFRTDNAAGPGTPTVVNGFRSENSNLVASPSIDVLETLRQRTGKKDEAAENSIQAEAIGSAIVIEKDDSSEIRDVEMSTDLHSGGKPGLSEIEDCTDRRIHSGRRRYSNTGGTAAQTTAMLEPDPGSAVVIEREPSTSSSASCQTLTRTSLSVGGMAERSQYLRRWGGGGAQAMSSQSDTTPPGDDDENADKPAEAIVEEPEAKEETVPSHDPSFLEVFAELKRLSELAGKEDEGSIIVPEYSETGIEGEMEISEPGFVMERSTPSIHSLASEEKPIEDYYAGEEMEIEPFAVDVGVETVCCTDLKRIKFKGPRKILSEFLGSDMGLSRHEDEIPGRESAYLKTNLGKYLPKALAEIEWFKPEDPIEYLAHWLLHRRKAEEEIKEETKKSDEIASIWKRREEEEEERERERLAREEEDERLKRILMRQLELDRLREMAHGEGEGEGYDPFMGIEPLPVLNEIFDDKNAEEKEFQQCIDNLVRVLERD